MENFQPAYCSRWEKPGGKPHACSSLDMFDFFLELKNRSPIIPSLFFFFFFSIHTSSQYKQFSHCPEIWSCSQDEAVTYWTSGKSNISLSGVLLPWPGAQPHCPRPSTGAPVPCVSRLLPSKALLPSKDRRCTTRTLKSRSPPVLRHITNPLLLRYSRFPSFASIHLEG